METGRNRLLASLVVGMLSTTLLTLACTRSEPPPGPTFGPKNWDIVVGPGACDLTENGKEAKKQVVSKKGGNVLKWRSNAGQPLSLVFHLPAGCPPPFKDMTPAGTDPSGLSLYRLGDGTKDTVHSGPIEKEACENKEIKYDQHLGSAKCDGIIIIQP